jgi:doubled CXXCH motif protein
MAVSITRKVWSVWAVATLLLLRPVVMTSADYVPGAGIAGSPHDFSGVTAGDTTTGACTFCHTPHKSYQTRLGWNHTLPNTGYTWSDYTVTSGGTPVPSIQSGWEGPTKFCLSCHDGSVAVGDIGWFNGKSWKGGAALDDRFLSAFNISQTVGSLAGNHPVAAPYPYLQRPNTYNGATTGSGVKLSDFNPDPTTLGIRLFKNPGGQEVSAGPSAGETGIECTSCHGAHNEKGIVMDKPLLRGTNQADSGNLCKKCHPNK